MAETIVIVTENIPVARGVLAFVKGEAITRELAEARGILDKTTGATTKTAKTVVAETQG